jgi:hypothetical protein
VTGGPNTNAPNVPVDYPAMGGGGAGGASGAAGGAGGGFGFPVDMPPGGGFTLPQGGTVPSGCAMHPLTPQEAALEFMFFDRSSCLVPNWPDPARDCEMSSYAGLPARGQTSRHELVEPRGEA